MVFFPVVAYMTVAHGLCWILAEVALCVLHRPDTRQVLPDYFIERVVVLTSHTHDVWIRGDG